MYRTSIAGSISNYIFLIMKVWKSSTADTKFSEFVRNRDKKCVRCGGKENLQCSHFWSRTHSSTRYDPENCDTLCYACHYGNSKGWEYDQAGEYRDFKIRQLGESRYQALEEKHRQFKERRKAIIELMEFLK